MYLIVCHPRDHILQVQLAAHICVLVNRHFLQNFMGKGCQTLRDIGFSRHLYSYEYFSLGFYVYLSIIAVKFCNI